MRVSAAAAELGCSVETIRRYERAGLIPPASRNRAGQRVYTASELAVIRRVLTPSLPHGPAAARRADEKESTA